MAGSRHSVVHLASPDDMEQQFYEALQHADLDRLMSVWSDEEEISCVHPGGPRLLGPRAIRASYEALFVHGALHVEPTQVRRLHTHSTAVHSLVERARVMTPRGPESAWVLVTNVYVKTGHGWRLVSHHASPGAPDEPGEALPSATTLLH